MKFQSHCFCHWQLSILLGYFFVFLQLSSANVLFFNQLRFVPLIMHQLQTAWQPFSGALWTSVINNNQKGHESGMIRLIMDFFKNIFFCCTLKCLLHATTMFSYLLPLCEFSPLSVLVPAVFPSVFTSPMSVSEVLDFGFFAHLSWIPLHLPVRCLCFCLINLWTALDLLWALGSEILKSLTWQKQGAKRVWMAWLLYNSLNIKGLRLGSTLLWPWWTHSTSSYWKNC